MLPRTAGRSVIAVRTDDEPLCLNKVDRSAFDQSKDLSLAGAEHQGENIGRDQIHVLSAFRTVVSEDLASLFQHHGFFDF